MDACLNNLRYHCYFLAIAGSDAEETLTHRCPRLQQRQTDNFH